MIVWFSGPPPPVLKVADEQDRLHQLKLHMPIRANSSLVLLKSVLEDQGVAYLPTYLIGDHIQKGDHAADARRHHHL